MARREQVLRLHPLPLRIVLSSGHDEAAVVSWPQAWPPPLRVIVAFSPLTARVGWCQSIDDSRQEDIDAGRASGMFVYVRKRMTRKGSSRTAYYQLDKESP